MTKEQEALKLALEATKVAKHGHLDHAWADEVIAKCEEALVQPEQPTLVEQLVKAHAEADKADANRNKADAYWNKTNTEQQKAIANWRYAYDEQDKANAEVQRIKQLIKEMK